MRRFWGLREFAQLIQCLMLIDGYSQTNSTRYIERLTAEQAAIQTQLVEVHGMEIINTGMRNAKINDDDDEHEDVDMASDAMESPMSKAIGAKQRAIAKFVGLLSIHYISHLIPITIREHPQAHHT